MYVPCLITPPVPGKRRRLSRKTRVDEVALGDFVPNAVAAPLLLEPEPKERKHTQRFRKGWLAPRPLQERVACPSRPLPPDIRERRLLPSFVENAVAQLAGDVNEHLKKGWGMAPGAAVEISVGTCCSGSELYMMSMAPLSAALSAKTGAAISFKHLWSCEKHPAKREWIWDVFRPGKIFCNVSDLSTGSAHDAVSGRLAPVDPVDILIAGFSCKDASRLNKHHSQRLQAEELQTNH